MKLTTILASLAIAGAVAVAALTSATSVEPAIEANTIHIVEHAGYFETKGQVYDIESGDYTFVINNRSGKDAGFVLARDGRDPLVVGIKNGETGRLETKLESGSYTYFCPIIPTAPYPLKVK